MAPEYTLHPDFLFDPHKVEGIVDFTEVFGNDNPLHIEIGSGKGTFLVSQAKAFPDINFIGIEWASRYYRHAVDRIYRHGLTNVRMMRDEAADFIAEHLADESVDWYHIYFPDPWPKKRHNKRRLVCDENVAQMIRTLKSGGVINIATDHDDYFEQMQQVLLDPEKTQIEQIPYTKPVGAREGEMAGTNFERKYLVEGRTTNVIAVRKKG
jgi:tRNA (guanine-N7-)-methyltransferase